MRVHGSAETLYLSQPDVIIPLSLVGAYPPYRLWEPIPEELHDLSRSNELVCLGT
jgi:hypothetical protein